ncbi:MAG TPA: MFS transporter [Roseiflexaceae bacterium]|nr:MFS transporter [Roseiflexaceae bacterium]HMP43198.1 MFS transporter [Roseiflexaceae bacterium]
MSTTPSSPAAEPAAPAGRLAPLAALRYRDFRLLWIGQLIAVTGSQMRTVAINWQVFELARASGMIDAALALGLIGLSRVIALVLVAPISGMFADRLDRRKVLIVSSLVGLLCSAILATLSWAGTPSIWVIYAMVTGASIANAFDMPARQALIPSLVPPARLPNALSLNIIAWQLATVVGPSIAGIMIAWAGVAPIYTYDAISFLGIITALLLMRTTPPPAPATKRPGLHEALEGLRFVLRHRLIASTMVLDFFATLFGAATTLMPIFAVQILNVGPLELGWMYSATAAGAMLAALVLSAVTIPHQGKVLLVAVALFGVCISIFGLSRSLPLSMLALAGAGASDTISMVIRGSMRQLLTPNELRGRMTAVNMVFFAGGPQLGEFQAGLLASLITAPIAVGIGGILCVITVAATAARVPELRNYYGPTDTESEERHA